MKYSLNLIFVLVLLISCQQGSKELINKNASLHQNDVLKDNPLLMHPITLAIQSKDSTMSTLYGNEIAFSHVKKNFNSDYPRNAVFYEVTWKQKPDELWFGANIPKEIVSIEKTTFVGKGEAVYEKYQGKPLKKVQTDKKTEPSRINFIISRNRVVSP